MSLAEKHCVPCRGGVPALQGEELDRLKHQLPDWQVVDGHHLVKTFTFPDFSRIVTAGSVCEMTSTRP